jgi:putative PIN family toxin of toxin-antitoxin system
MMMRKVVIDTNVVVSSNLKANGNESDVLKRFYSGELRLFYSDEILSEYKRVLAYDKFGFDTEIQNKVITAIETAGIQIEPDVSTIPFTDETDRTFYDTAKASGATLITGNTKHYPAEPFIMTSTEFLKSINNEK